MLNQTKIMPKKDKTILEYFAKLSLLSDIIEECFIDINLKQENKKAFNKIRKSLSGLHSLAFKIVPEDFDNTINEFFEVCKNFNRNEIFSNAISLLIHLYKKQYTNEIISLKFETIIHNSKILMKNFKVPYTKDFDGLNEFLNNSVVGNCK